MSIINKCEAQHGGSLGTGAVEADRDGNFSVAAHSISGQSGSFSAQIDFPSCHINYIKYRMFGISYLYDGDSTYSLTVQICVAGAWTTIASASGHAGGSTDLSVTDTSQSNGGAGWDGVTGIKYYASIWGNDTSSASASGYEMQAWGWVSRGYGGIV